MKPIKNNSFLVFQSYIQLEKAEDLRKDNLNKRNCDFFFILPKTSGLARQLDTANINRKL